MNCWGMYGAGDVFLTFSPKRDRDKGRMTKGQVKDGLVRILRDDWQPSPGLLVGERKERAE